MLFNSLDFVLLFAVVLAVYRVLDRKAQNYLLLVVSYVFYGWWNWHYLALIFVAAVVDFTAGRGIARAATPHGRRRWLVCSIVFNLGILCYFKYLDFFLRSAVDALQLVGLEVHAPTLHVLLPIGISFFIFQSMSYIIDVYRGAAKATDSLPDYLLFVSFFPQLAAGPIERANHLLGQFQRDRTITPDGVYSGLLLILWGLFKKVAIADNLGVYVDVVYNNYAQHSGSSLLLATYLFAFQIYCDFSGYSDMAAGLARLLGIDMMTNFRAPYFSESVQEFWRRWHISLSTWFRDYVYIPLGGSRGTGLRVAVSLMVVFLVSGLWHGANWTFLVWDGLHGAYLVGQRLFGRARTPATGWRRLARILVTFHLVCLAWIFFRAPTVTAAISIIVSIAANHGAVFLHPKIVDGLVCLGLLLVLEAVMEPRTFDRWLVQRPSLAHLVVATGVLFGVILLGQQQGAQFIYFQF